MKTLSALADQTSEPSHGQNARKLTRSFPDPASNPPGALVIGGNYRALCIARSLGRHGITVWAAAPQAERIAGLSRYVRRTLWNPQTATQSQEAQARYLLKLAEEHQLDGWVLFPSSDEDAAFLARFRDELSARFRVSTPDWETVQWAYDKRFTYRLAAEHGVDHPWTLCPESEEELAQAECPFPVILKPATKVSVNQFTVDKAWPAENRAALLARYREAKQLIPPELIVVQEMIPGGGEAQFSFAALCLQGRPLATVTARRSRQYPIDFGHSSCFVETIHAPQIEEAGRRLLAAIQYTGVAEVEFKYDRRDGRYKLLDINPRVWTWVSLCRRAGVDFPYLLWQLTIGAPAPANEIRGREGVRWVRMSTDLPAALQEIVRGRLTVGAYLKSLRGPLEPSLLAADDPLPGLADLPLLLYSFLKRHE